MDTRIALISDLHYHLWQNFSKDGGMSRLKEVSNVFHECRHYCKISGIKKLAILGDVFEKRGVVDSVVYNQFTEDIKVVLADGMDVYIIPGNHDQDLISNTTFDNSLEPLSRLSPNLHVFSNPTITSIYGKRVYFIPYIHDHRILREKLETNACDYAFIHAGIAGAKTIDSDYKVKDGLNIEGLPIIGIFSGHLHTPHSIGNATYIGSPLHHSFSDVGQTKGFIVLDLETGEYKRVPTHYPEFRQLEIKDPKEIFSISSDDYYRLIVNEIILTEEHHTHLQVNTKGYQVKYIIKKDTEAYYTKFDSDLRCLRKYITKEFSSDHRELYLKAKEYL